MPQSFRCALALSCILLPASFALAQQAPTRFPPDKASDVNPDTHLVLTFSSPPTIGNSGKITIHDAADDKVVDTLDMSIPASNAGAGRGGARGGGTAVGTPFVYTYAPNTATNANTVPGTASSSLPATPATAQLTIIGGLSDAYHFNPIIVRGNTATIYPHNNLLVYGKSYYVTIDKGVLTGPGFDALADKTAWTFSTKKAGPAVGASRVIVAADGMGDFNTVQGAIDFVPDKTPNRTTIFVKNGTYEEIVLIRNRTNITILGEDRKNTVVTYGNYDTFNPAPAGYTSNEKKGTFPYRRPAFMVDNSQGIQLVNLTIRNPATAAQAEALLFMGGQNIVSNVDLWGNTDTIQFNDSVYTFDTFIDGGGDFLWGRGPCYFANCDIQEHGANNPGAWVRSTSASHGFVFNGCRFNAPNGTGAGPIIARNTAAYPESEFVLLNCAIGSKYSPVGFTIPGATDAMHYYEYNSTNLADGTPYDVSRRAAGTKELTKEKDADTIKNYSAPAWVMGGWTPKMAPIVINQPAAVAASAGVPVILSAKAAAVPAPTYQWFKNNTPIDGATGATLAFKAIQAADAGAYTVKATNDSGSDTSAAAVITLR